jgi:type I restriction enzyme, R subunit
MSQEAQARIKINKLLEEAGWRFEADGNGPANIQLEAGPEHRRADFENNYGK